jgi:hypothetical protein
LKELELWILSYIYTQREGDGHFAVITKSGEDGSVLWTDLGPRGEELKLRGGVFAFFVVLARLGGIVI